MLRLAVDKGEDAGLGKTLSRVALGDRKSFGELYNATSRKLFSVCRRMLRDQADAEEALQEIYVKVWRNASRYNPDKAAPMTWLISIARNHAIDTLRARRPDAEDLDTVYDMSDPAPGPEANAVNAGEGRRIDDCMQILESGRAEAVRSAYVEGLSYMELAEMHDVPVNTMRTWLRRSLLKLRECLDQ
jgi:RNA polymerase sigma-70 factor, ECF subfamily